MAKNFDEIRGVKISFGATPSAFSTDAYKALLQRISELEDKYEANPASVPNVTAQKMVITGNTPYKVYTFNLTTTMATGVYVAEFVSEAPNP